MLVNNMTTGFRIELVLDDIKKFIPEIYKDYVLKTDSWQPKTRFIALINDAIRYNLWYTSDVLDFYTYIGLSPKLISETYSFQSGQNNYLMPFREFVDTYNNKKGALIVLEKIINDLSTLHQGDIEKSKNIIEGQFILESEIAYGHNGEVSINSVEQGMGYV